MTRLTARADRRLIRPTNRSRRHVLVEVTAPSAPRTNERAAVNLAFVIDRSGSMGGEKLELAKSAVREALTTLTERDRFSVVTYDDRVEVVVESTAGSDEAKRNAVTQLSTIDARGTTDLSGGWLRGCEQVAAHLTAEAVDRVLLLTDGLANKGITDHDELTRHAAELRARGVSTTTFGVGDDFDEALLQSMADAGGGHFYYIASPAQIRDHIASEVGETLDVVAQDVALELLAGEGVRIETISPHRLEARGTRTVVTLGDLVSDQGVDVVLRLTFPVGDLGRETGLIVNLTDRDRVFAAAGVGDARLTWTYADHPANDAQPRDPEVDRAVARQFAARARQHAVKANRQRDFGEAEWWLTATAKRIRQYAGRDAELRDLVAQLEAEAQHFNAPMAAYSLKEAHFNASTMARSRTVTGRAMRRS
jgi:Ca-activated chloride channel family protein